MDSWRAIQRRGILALDAPKASFVERLPGWTLGGLLLFRFLSWSAAHFSPGTEFFWSMTLSFRAATFCGQAFRADQLGIRMNAADFNSLLLRSAFIGCCQDNLRKL